MVTSLGFCSNVALLICQVIRSHPIYRANWTTCSVYLALLPCTKYLDLSNLVEIVAAAPICAQQRVVYPSPRRRKRPAVSSSPARTTSDCSELTNLNQVGLSYPLQEAPNGYVDGICGQLCNSAWPVRDLTISDGLYNFSELRGADRAARSCSPARATTSVPPHPAIDSDAAVHLVGF